MQTIKSVEWRILRQRMKAGRVYGKQGWIDKTCVQSGVYTLKCIIDALHSHSALTQLLLQCTQDSNLALLVEER